MSIALILFVILSLHFFAFEWRHFRKWPQPDPQWEREFKATPFRERRRIVKAVSRGEQLDKANDARLAVGVAERQHYLLTSLQRLQMPRLALGVLIALLGLLSGALLVLAMGAVFIAIALTDRALKGRTIQRLERAEETNRAQANLGTDQPGQ